MINDTYTKPSEWIKRVKKKNAGLEKLTDIHILMYECLDLSV